tara:strand:- start:2935 stop:5184 length:2250 start_codon:yes stop_codon:yes gene_type:complete
MFFLNIKVIRILFLLLFVFYIKTHSAEEILIYADSISYDSEENIIANGNAKVISENEIIISDLIIYNQKKLKYIIPLDFQFKDEKNNLYSGSSGEFSKNLKSALINDPKILMSDGSRIVGKKLKRDNHIDIVTKGAFSPCSSRINIKNFVCPIWQIEDEKLLHDRENLFLYHKHSKMRILNLPVAYIPYLVTPSPLRKERKSGFLNPKISLNFIDAQTEQSISLPYYFNLDIDKELYFTPIINYGGGVDSSQRFLFDYNQVISGGNFNFDVSVDTQVENENNETWFKDGSFTTSIDKNLNEKFSVSFNSALQTSPTYLRRTDINNLLNQEISLKSSLSLNGYSLRKFDDHLNFKISSYQVIQKDDDNKTSPTALPYIRYNAGNNYYKNTRINNKISFYNIFRDSATSDLAQRQQKLYHNVSTDNVTYKFKSKINFKTELLTQFYNIENKPRTNDNYTGTYQRVFPMTGLYLETPIRNIKYNFNINPKVSFIFNGSQSSSDKVSNEEAQHQSYSLLNNTSLNRFEGTDKLDNSKRVNYGLDLIKNNLKTTISQSYEFDGQSTYNNEIGLRNHLSDILFSTKLDEDKYQLNYDNQIDVDEGDLKSQAVGVALQNKLGDFSASYSENKIISDSQLVKNSESMSFNYNSSKINNYNNIGLSINYDLMKDYAPKYSTYYKYTDECFGIDLKFERNAFEEKDLKPEDKLTLMFSFKFLGSYASSNLAVSEQDKQDISWETNDIDNARFLNITNEE